MFVILRDGTGFIQCVFTGDLVRKILIDKTVLLLNNDFSADVMML